MASKGSSASRSSNWAFLVYPDDTRVFSASLELSERRALLVSVLESLKVPCAVSPLHDKDVWEDGDEFLDPSHVSGSPKKPHWHVLVRWDSVKSPKQVLDILSPLLVSHVERVESWRGYTRYLCHLDNPEKAPYQLSGVTSVMGFDLSPLYDVAKSDERAIRNELMAVIRDNGICSLHDLYDACMSLSLSDAHLDYVVARAHFFGLYFRG